MTRRPPCLTAATALLVIAFTSAASCQVIDQYLDADVPGYDTAAGVTVASRQHPGYDPQGVRVGSFLLTPVLSESAGYDDNVTGTARARGSAVIETNASVGAAGGWSGTTIVASLNVDDFEYPEESRQSFTNFTAAAGISHDFGQDTLYVGATHLNLSQTSRDLNVPNLDSSAAFRVDDVRANYKIDLGRALVQPGVDVSYYNFDNGSVDGTPYLQSYRDRVVVSPSITGSYEFATRRRVVVVLRDTQSDFDTAPPGQPRQNFNDVSVLAGLAYDADGIIVFRLLGGYEERSFASSLYSAIQAPILEGKVTWTPTGLDTVTATAARYIEDSAAEATTGYTETALKLNLDHELLRNVIVSLHGAAYLDNYDHSQTSAGGSQSFYTGGVGASWLLDRNIRLAADYTYSSRNSNNNGQASPTVVLSTGEVFGSDYSENVFRLTLRLAL